MCSVLFELCVMCSIFFMCAGKDTKTIPVPKCQSVTLLNFFACGANKPIPVPASKAKTKKQLRKKHPPPKTRVAKFGRPIKQQEPEVVRKEKTEKMREQVKRKCADGALACTPKKRKEWSGSVCNHVVDVSVRNYFICMFSYLIFCRCN